MKAQGYGLGEIFEKRLLFLIPFYIFTHESLLEEYDRDEARLEELKEEYEGIKGRLEKLSERQVIDEYTKCTIIDMSNKVLEHLASKYERVREGVKEVMGGRSLEYEAKEIRNEGRNEGIAEGKLELLLELVKSNLLSIKEAAARIDLSEETFKEKMRNYQG